MSDLSDFGFELPESSFYKKLRLDETYKKVLRQIDQKFINEIQTYMSHDFRYYQKQPLSVFDFFQKVSREEYAFKEELYESEFADGTIPFYGFEMATGSGKTLLIGAMILYLHEYHNFKNFLIITPGTTIYEKTIGNFDMMDAKCVFSNYMDVKYNIVTGDNFIDRSSNYDEDADFTIFIFNIQKFFERETGVLKLDKEWEESIWEDKLGNTISFREYLENERLIIITDEAHHYQKFRVGREKKSSGDIITSLNPEMVLEFTATAVTKEETENRRAQKIIYNYPINDFIADGYGKKVRAYGYTGSPYKAESADVTEDDKKKFLVSFMIHLVKKKALEKENFKPIVLVRARDIPHANNLLDWIQEELPNETEVIEKAYNEIITGQKFEITELITKYVSLGNFTSEIAKLPNKSFVYHSENENEEDVREKVSTIETNDQEVLIQIKKLEEGWDIRNPYTILILSLSRGTMKTYVKQLIGRGVRLFREKRRWDDLTGFLDKQQEILHVICEKGSNFEEFIEEIRKEMGLTGSTLETEMIEEKRMNKTIAKFEKYNELQLPILTLSSKYSLTAEKLVDSLTYKNLQLDLFIDQNTYSERGEVFWRWDEEEIGMEKAVDDDVELKRGRAKYTTEPLSLQQLEVERILTMIIASQTLLPSHTSVKSKLRDAIKEINKANINFKNRNSGSRGFYVNQLSYHLIEFIQNVIDNYFETTDRIKKDGLKAIFPDSMIIVKKTPETGKITNIKRKEDINIDRIEGFKSILITGFNKSYHEYNWFESSHEFKLAYQLDILDDVEFWIRNKRTYYHEYGMGNRYHPDFIIKHGPDIFIVEVKGSGYSETARTGREVEVLKKLKDKGYNVLFLLDNTIDKKIYKKSKTFEDIINSNDLEHFSSVR